MQLLDHVSITVRNLERVKPFYLGIMSHYQPLLRGQRAITVLLPSTT